MVKFGWNLIPGGLLLAHFLFSNGVFSLLYDGVVQNLFEVDTELTCLVDSS